jgi:hypothetical protein
MMIPEAQRIASGYKYLLSDLRAMPDDTAVISLDDRALARSTLILQPVTSRPAYKCSDCWVASNGRRLGRGRPSVRENVGHRRLSSTTFSRARLWRSCNVSAATRQSGLRSKTAAAPSIRILRKDMWSVRSEYRIFCVVVLRLLNSEELRTAEGRYVHWRLRGQLDRISRAHKRLAWGCGRLQCGLPDRFGVCPCLAKQSETYLAISKRHDIIKTPQTGASRQARRFITPSPRIYKVSLKAGQKPFGNSLSSRCNVAKQDHDNSSEDCAISHKSINGKLSMFLFRGASPSRKEAGEAPRPNTSVWP